MTRAWVRQSVCVRAAVVIGVVAGCATARTSIESSTNLKNTAPVTRLLIFEDLQHAFYSADLYGGFVERVKSGLTSCGVTASIEQAPGLVNFNELVAGPIETFHASSVMLIFSEGEDVHHPSNGTDTYKLRFKLKLLDVVSNKVMWAAESKVYMTTSWTTDDVENGARLGAAIVSRLQDDGVLTGCPSAQ